MNEYIKKFKRKIETEQQLNILKAQFGNKLQNGQNQLVIADNGYQQYKDVANLSWAVQIMETKLTKEFHKIHTYEEFKKFRNKYKDYIFIDYFMWDPIKI